MRILKQSTAVDVMLGPFVDDTDGKTTEEALTLSQADLQLTKNGGAAAQKTEATSATHIYGGNYKVPLDATDTGTLGQLRLMCKEAGALPIIADFMVVPANVYDSVVSGSDLLQVDVEQVDGGATAAGNLKLAGDNYSATRGLAGTALPDAAADAAGGVPITAGGLLALDTLLGRITGNVALASVCTETRLAELDAANLPADVAAVKSDTAAILTDTGTTLDTKIDAIKAQTDNLPPGIKKNTELANFEFVMTDSTNHAPAAGLTVTATRSIDGGAFAACANAVSAVASGVYKITLAAADLNGSVVTLRFTAASADDRLITIKTSV